MGRHKSSTTLTCPSCKKAGSAFWDGTGEADRHLESLSTGFKRVRNHSSGLPEVICANCNVRVLLKAP